MSAGPKRILQKLPDCLAVTLLNVHILSSGSTQERAIILMADGLILFWIIIGGLLLDNNLCEQALKMAIRRRKNSLFYKTQRGADVGDTYMSLIHTVTLPKPIRWIT